MMDPMPGSWARSREISQGCMGVPQREHKSGSELSGKDTISQLGSKEVDS